MSNLTKKTIPTVKWLLAHATTKYQARSANAVRLGLKLDATDHSRIRKQLVSLYTRGFITRSTGLRDTVYYVTEEQKTKLLKRIGAEPTVAKPLEQTQTMVCTTAGVDDAQNSVDADEDDADADGEEPRLLDDDDEEESSGVSSLFAASAENDEEEAMSESEEA